MLWQYLSFFYCIIVDGIQRQKSKVNRKLIIPNLKEDMSHYQSLTLPKATKSKRYREKDQINPQGSSTQHYIPNLKARQSNKNYHNDSIQTCSSDRSQRRQAASIPHNHKVQLCKNYIAKGYCPYENRCRFAHGVEELRARDADQTCELYRTRKCKVFFDKGQCRFGQRCNFRHENRTLSQICSEYSQNINSKMKKQFSEVFLAVNMQKRSSSRLLSLLNN